MLRYQAKLTLTSMSCGEGSEPQNLHAEFKHAYFSVREVHIQVLGLALYGDKRQTMKFTSGSGPEHLPSSHSLFLHLGFWFISVLQYVFPE